MNGTIYVGKDVTYNGRVWYVGKIKDGHAYLYRAPDSCVIVPISEL